MEQSNAMKAADRGDPRRITVIYVVVASIWILFSDRLLVAFVHDSNLIGWIALLKGWFFVAVTAWLLYALVSRALERSRQADTALRQSEERHRSLREETLRERHEELERFTYTVSHDLRSPLVTIKTYLGYLEQDMAHSGAGRIAEDLHYIRGAADKMGLMLDELLELSRVGRMVNPLIEISFRELVQEALDIMAGPISRRGVHVEVADRQIIFSCDKARLVAVWQNLVENGVKFMGEEKTPRIEIGAEKRNGDTVFFVRDNGAGLDPRYHEKVFGLFEKLDSRAEGTGLGLALVRRIVALYGGEAWIESPGLGHGTTVCFTVPGAIIKEEFL